MARKRACAEETREGATEASGEPGGQEAGESKGASSSGVVGVDFYVEEYLKDRGVDHKRDGLMVKIKCVACRGRGRPLTVSNDLGTWKCGSCTRNGGFDDLRRLLGDEPVVSVEQQVVGQYERLVPQFTPVKMHREYTRALRSEGKAKHDWLLGLGCRETVLKEFRVGYNKEFDALVFPYLYRRALGSCSYLRMLREPMDWWKVDGSPITASWFGQQRFKVGWREAVITQSPLGALVLASHGVANVLAPYVDTERVALRGHNMALLNACERVLLVPDNTDAGVAWAAKMQEQVGVWRTRIAQIDKPAHRINSLSEFEAAKERAVSRIAIRVADARDLLWEVDRKYEGEEELHGYPSRLEPLDKLLGGWRSGEVTVLSGETGAGKSTFACFLSLLQASAGRSVLHMSFEVAPGAIVRKWVRMLAGKPLEDLTRSEYVEARRKLARRSLHVPLVSGRVNLSQVRQVVSNSVNNKGVGMIVVDHIGFIEVTGEENRLRAPGIVMGDLKRLALESGVHVLVVSHVRKKKLGDKPNSLRGLEDLFGTGEVGQLADNVAVLRRVLPHHAQEKNGLEKNLSAGLRSTAVDLLKVRDDSGYEGTVKLGFNPESLRFEPH